LLRFLVEQAIAGGPPLEESTIASRVFGRSGNFAPEVDPVVPVQWRRLRSALLEFYAAEGCPGPVMLGASQDKFGLVVMNPAAVSAAHRWLKTKWLVAFAALAACAGVGLHFETLHAKAGKVAQLSLRARALLARGTQADVRASIDLFDQAVALDSRYAPAWSGLASALIAPAASGDYTWADSLLKAGQAASEALRLDPRDAEAHGVLAYVKFFHDMDWPGAEAEYRQAIQLDSSAPRLHFLYAEGLMSRGRFDDAIAQSSLAASLEPANETPAAELALILCAARRYDEAIAKARQIVQQTKGSANAHLILGVALTGAGRYDEAVDELRAAIMNGHSLYALARLGYADGAKGDSVAARAVLVQLAQAFDAMVTPRWTYMALVYAGMGDNQSTLTCLENGAANHESDLIYIGVEPAYGRLHSEPRFVALKKSLGLP
jgi:serine/threonine-protein kinase